MWQCSSRSDLCVLVLWLGGKAGGVLLSPLHAHQLHLSLGEAEYEATQKVCDGQGVGQGQTHQTCSQQHTLCKTDPSPITGARPPNSAADSPGSTELYWCWTTAITPRPVTTATPIICRRMLSHCVVALLRNRQRWFCSRRLAISSSNLEQQNESLSQ